MGDTNPRNYSTSTTYYGNGRVHSVLDRAGYATTFSYDNGDRRIAALDARGNVTSMTYFDNGLKKADVDAQGHATTLTYDGGNRPYTVQNPLGDVATTLYYANGLVSNSQRTAFGGALAVTTHLYDDAARRIGVVNPLGHATTTVYYPNGQVQSVQDPLGHVTTYQYDAANRPTVVTDANGHSTTTTYDTANRRIIVQDATGAVTTTVYDLANRKVQVQDGNGHVTTFLYDSAGRLQTTIDPLLRRTTLSYDGANNVIGKQDARPLTATFSYDPNNRLLGAVYPDYVATFTYDPVGNRLLAQDGTGDYTSSFTTRNQVMSVEDPNAQSVYYTYDASGQRLTMTDPTSGVFSSTRDAAGRLLLLENPRLEQTSYTYDLNERLTQTGLANGGNEQRGYDIADRLTSVANYDSLGSVQTAYSYVLDNVGNRTQMSDYVGAVTQYAYNQRDELLWEGVVAAPLSWNSFTLAQWVAFTLAQWVDFVLNDVPSESVTYTYDNVGNRLTMTSSGAVTTYSYDGANQLQTSVAPGGAVTTYSYDGAGNLVGENVAGAATSYIFDGPNRMTDVYPATGSDVTFVYDPDGRRVQKAVGAELTRFVWDGERLLVENDAANTPQVEYTQSDAGFGNLVSEYQTGSGSFQHAFDGLGSTGALLDGSGAVADRWAYSAFGLQETAPADEPTRLTFGGQLGYQYDLELDLYYCRNRYYDPVTGRWVNQDPAQADPINNYRYCGNNPVTSSDPSGLQEDVTCDPMAPRADRGTAGWWLDYELAGLKNVPRTDAEWDKAFDRAKRAADRGAAEIEALAKSKYYQSALKAVTFENEVLPNVNPLTLREDPLYVRRPSPYMKFIERNKITFKTKEEAKKSYDSFLARWAMRRALNAATTEWFTKVDNGVRLLPAPGTIEYAQMQQRAFVKSMDERNITGWQRWMYWKFGAEEATGNPANFQNAVAMLPVPGAREPRSGAGAEVSGSRSLPLESEAPGEFSGRPLPPPDVIKENADKARSTPYDKLPSTSRPPEPVPESEPATKPEPTEGPKENDPNFIGPPRPPGAPRADAGSKALGQLQTKFDELAERDLIPKYRELDPNLKWGYTGSFKTGEVGNSNKPTFGQPIDLSNFDVDVWIESDILYKKFGDNLRADIEFRKLLSNTPGFEGLKPNKQGFSIKFKPSQSN